MTSSSCMRPMDIHRECWDLLPWLANERAAPPDVARIETHLRECRECQQELAAQRAVREAIRSDEPIVLAPQTSLQKLMQRIDSVEDAAEADSIERTSERTESAARASLRWTRLLPIAAAVQGIAILVLLGALWQQDRETLTAPRFWTLETQTAPARGPVIRVVFVEEVALQEVSDLVRSVNAQIIAGPSEAGVYALALTSDAASRPEIEAALARLRADGRVIFAESVKMQVELR
jgi:hypothetical protein